MLLRQISWKIILHPNLDWLFICSIDSVSKNTQILISLMAILNPCHFHSQPTLLPPLLSHVALSVCLSLSLSVCLSVSLLFANFPGRFYLSPFHINTQQIWCLIIIDHNKLIEETTIEIGLEHAPFVVLVYFFLIWTCKKPADYGPQHTKNSSLKCDFLIINYA